MDAVTAPVDAPAPPPRVDLARPLLAQVAGLGDAYDAYIHDGIGPRAAETANRALVAAADPVARRWPASLRIFENPVLEALTHIAWWVIPLVWLPINVTLLAISVNTLGLTAEQATGWTLLGLLGWTLTEYLLHRFVFHFRPRTALGRRFHFLVHGIHHLDPWDRTRLVFPPLAGLAVAATIFGAMLLVLPLAIATATMAGLLTGYVIYDLTHYFTHHARPRSKWGRFLKAWHLAHHHKFWTRMFGVSTPFWDLVLRTGKPETVVESRSPRA